MTPRVTCKSVDAISVFFRPNLENKEDGEIGLIFFFKLINTDRIEIQKLFRQKRRRPKMWSARRCPNWCGRILNATKKTIQVFFWLKINYYS